MQQRGYLSESFNPTLVRLRLTGIRTAKGTSSGFQSHAGSIEASGWLGSY